MAAPTSLTTVQPAGSGAGAAPAQVSWSLPGVIVMVLAMPPRAPGDITSPVRSDAVRNMLLFCLIHRLRLVIFWFCAAAVQGAMKAAGAMRQTKFSHENAVLVRVWSELRGLLGTT